MGPSDVNIVQVLVFQSLFELKQWFVHLFMSKAKLNSVRYSVSESQYTKVEVINVNKAFVYIQGL